MFVLSELPEGLALFKIADKDAGDADRIARNFASPEATAKVTHLKAFREFTDMEEAVAVSAAIMDRSELPETLVAFLAENISAGDVLHCGDSHMAKLISDKFGINARASSESAAILRGLRSAIGNLVEGVNADAERRMAVALAHAVCRFRLRCGTDKVDVMIMQAISILDDTEKELNVYVMRLREWYGWHWPEIVTAISDPLTFARIALELGMRSNVTRDALEGVIGLDAETAELVAYKAATSMGFDVTEDNMRAIQAFARQVVALCEHRAALLSFLDQRMRAIAPGLTALVGVNVGARLIAQAGSLVNLAKAPASTVQLLGAAKSLFRALKKNTPTPKYGVLYHARYVQQASNVRAKGRIARTLAGKTALMARLDALSTAATEEERATQAEAARQWAGDLEHGLSARLDQLNGTARVGRKGAEAFKRYNGASAPNGRNFGTGDLVLPQAGVPRVPEPVAEAPVAETVAEAQAEVAQAAEKVSKKADKEAEKAAKEAEKAEKAAKKAEKAEKAAKKAEKAAKKAAKASKE